MSISPAGDIPAIEIRGLAKSYGDVCALAGIDLSIRRGQFFGLLGPNGAGKSTTIHILTGLVTFSEGTVRVLGHDVVRDYRMARRRIGLAPQEFNFDRFFPAREILVLQAGYYGIPRREAGRRADELLERFGLADVGNKPVKQYSGGMRRRLDLAASLILAPAVLFLDEPTTGLDPRGRNEVWDAIRALVRDGTTVLLTTQYLDEADQLSDRICVIDLGRVIANGTPIELKSSLGGDRIDLVLRDTADLGRTAELLAQVVGSEADVDTDNRRLSAPVENRVSTLTEVLRAIESAGIDAEDVALRRPTLDEVFLHLTGRRPTDDSADAEAQAPEAATAENKEVAA